MAEIDLVVEGTNLKGNLEIPGGARGIVLFVHGSGSGRLSPRNNYVAQVLNKAGLATLLFDLLTEEEDAIYENRFDIDRLTERLKAVMKWCESNSETKDLKVGYFGASTGAAAALAAAAVLGDTIKAVVSRGGRPDLAGEKLFKVTAPTLLIVGGLDTQVIELNQEAEKKLAGLHRIEIVPGATHLFEEPGTLEKTAELAADWFKRYLLD